MKYKMTLIFVLICLIGQSQTAANPVNPQNDFQLFIDNFIWPIAKIAALFSFVLAALTYRLKLREEIRLSESAKAENDVKLLSLFSEIFQIAHSRKNTVLSEKIIEKLIADGIITKSDFGAPMDLYSKLELAKVPIPVGAASQDAAIASIGLMGLKYDILWQPALIGLKKLRDQNILGTENCTLKYIDELEKKSSGKTNII